MQQIEEKDITLTVGNKEVVLKECDTSINTDDLKQIEKELNDLYEILKDLDKIVVDQGESINAINRLTEFINTNIVSSQKLLAYAAELSRKYKVNPLTNPVFLALLAGTVIACPIGFLVSVPVGIGAAVTGSLGMGITWGVNSLLHKKKN